MAGFDPKDFADWPAKERVGLEEHVDGFLTVAVNLRPDEPASKLDSKRARGHPEQAVRIVRPRLLKRWLGALREMMGEAAAAAAERGWHVEADEKEVAEALLGTYAAPRLRIRTNDREAVLEPIAYFCSGKRGVVDLVALPSYETKSLVTYEGDGWHIVAPRGALHRRPFTRATLVSTINHLPRA